MKKYLVALATLTCGFTSILQADQMTNATDRYLSGDLDSRLEELGTDKGSGEKKPLWRATQEEGLKRHCRKTLEARGTGVVNKCLEARLF